MDKRWFFRPPVVRRDSDGSLWIPPGDVPYPLMGWNFARARKAWFGWFADLEDRWITYSPRGWEIVRG